MDYNNGGLSTEMGLYTSMDYNNGGLSTEMGTVYILVWIIIMVVCLQRWEWFMY